MLKIEDITDMNPEQIISNSTEILTILGTLANESGNLDTSCLDDLVHDTASDIASKVNNQGTLDQIEYLLSNSPTQDTIKEIVNTLKPVEGLKCNGCKTCLHDSASIVRTYTNKDDGANVKCHGHYDENGGFEADEKVDLSNGRYDLCELSDKCSNCGEFVG